MRLVDLEPRFLKIVDERTFRSDGTIQDDGLCLLCPTCFEKNDGNVGTHSIICWRPHVPQTYYPIPGRWEMQGTGFDDLTLAGATSSSVLITEGCMAHFFIRSGAIIPA